MINAKNPSLISIYSSVTYTEDTLTLAVFSGYILKGQGKMVIKMMIIITSVMTIYYIYSVPGFQPIMLNNFYLLYVFR